MKEGTGVGSQGVGGLGLQGLGVERSACMRRSGEISSRGLC